MTWPTFRSSQSWSCKPPGSEVHSEAALKSTETSKATGNVEEQRKVHWQLPSWSHYGPRWRWMPQSQGGGRGAGFSFPHSTSASLTYVLFLIRPPPYWFWQRVCVTSHKPHPPFPNPASSLYACVHYILLHSKSCTFFLSVCCSSGWRWTNLDQPADHHLVLVSNRAAAFVLM